jgi:3-phenylpropionate/cinnamic acid dioxygenase small subunit
MLTSDFDRVAAFLFDEAELLDERRWDAWLALFAEDGAYWVPLTQDQPDPVNHVSLFYEDALMREVRARRLEEKRAWSQQPMARASRLVGNLRLLEPPAGTDIMVRSTFHLVEWRAPRQRVLAGRYTHRLRRHGMAYRILEKRVDLVDSDGVHETLEMFL